jgi:hypothetical protein
MHHRNVAYLILAHADLPHLRRLVTALPADSVKLVHMDRKFGAAPDLSAVPNTVVLSDRIAVYWADFSIVEATLSLLRAALHFGQVERIVLLSGSCYPIASDDDILDFFAARPAANFIKAFSIEDASALYHDKIGRIHVGEESIARLAGTHPAFNHALSRGLTLLLSWRKRDWRRGLAPLKPYFGSQWWAITRACGEYILEREEECRALQFFEHCFAPDEMYFHTIVANSPCGNDSIVPFEGRGNWRLANLHLINDGSLRYVFDLSDLERVHRSNKLFVRKVNSAQSGPLLDALDARRSRRVVPTDALGQETGGAKDIAAYAVLAAHRGR